MKNLFLLLAIILFSVTAASAQDQSGAKHHQKSQAEGPQGKVFRVEGGGASKGRVLRVGHSTTYLKEGLSTEEVETFMGRPASVRVRQEGNATLTTYVYKRGEGRVLLVEFVNGSLVQTRTGGLDSLPQTVPLASVAP